MAANLARARDPGCAPHLGYSEFRGGEGEMGKVTSTNVHGAWRVRDRDAPSGVAAWREAKKELVE